MQENDLVELTNLHHAMNKHLKKYIGLVGRVSWVIDNRVRVVFPPNDFWSQHASFVVSKRHLTRRPPDADTESAEEVAE